MNNMGIKTKIFSIKGIEVEIKSINLGQWIAIEKLGKNNIYEKQLEILKIGLVKPIIWKESPTKIDGGFASKVIEEILSLTRDVYDDVKVKKDTYNPSLRETTAKCEPEYDMPKDPEGLTIRTDGFLQ